MSGWAPFSAAIAAFDDGGAGTHTFDVKALASAWIAGTNDGVLLEQTGAYNTNFFTSEDPLQSNHPSLNVCYTLP